MASRRAQKKRLLSWRVTLHPANRFHRFIVAVSILLGSRFSAIASAQVLQSEENQGTIHGTVVNAVTRAPIPRALVSSGDGRFAMLTDSDGNFEFTVPKTGGEQAGPFTFSYIGSASPASVYPTQGLWLTARKPGFLGDPNRQPDLETSPGSGITIPLAPESLIKGRVSISSAEAASGITLELFSRQVREGRYHWIRSGQQRTNSNGEFRFPELSAGKYKLLTNELMDNDPVDIVPRGQSYGYPPVYYPGATDFSSAETIEVAAGQTIQADLTITRQAYYPVKIPIANNDPSGGMNIRVSPQSQRSPGYSLGLNAETQHITGLLPNGNYMVEAMSYGPNGAGGDVNIQVSGGPVEGPTLTLHRAGSIHFNVEEQFNDRSEGESSTWSDGRHSYTLRGPRLYLQGNLESLEDFGQGPGGGSIRPPTGVNDDSLDIQSVSPGRYWLHLFTSRGYVASAMVGNTDVSQEPLTVSADSSSTVEIKMRDDFAQIEGTVSGIAARATAESQSSPIAWVECIPLPGTPGTLQQISVSADGSFSSATVPPGSYRVLAFNHQLSNPPYRDPEFLQAYESKGQVIHLAGGEKASIQVQVVANEE